MEPGDEIEEEFEVIGALELDEVTARDLRRTLNSLRVHALVIAVAFLAYVFSLRANFYPITVVAVFVLVFAVPGFVGTVRAWYQIQSFRNFWQL
jgi:hypothetical protein